MSGREGAARAASRGVSVGREERVVPFGDGFLIRSRGGFEPCPWAFDLARFTPARPGDRVLDLGTGGGALLIALAQIYPSLGPKVGLELDPAACDQARRNARLADAAFAVVRGDVRDRPVAPRAFDLVVANPPFYPRGWGRESADARVHAATHALNGTVEDFAAAAAQALAPHGRGVFVFDSGQLAALLLGLGAAGLTARALRFLTDDRGSPARVLVVAGRDGGGLQVDRA
ncbi:methyltransferase [Myxococcota bacterium]|nr:methyltransferase [Myxococcota bacterium]